MHRTLPWLRSIIALPLGIVAIDLFHRLAALAAPELYGSLPDQDAQRMQMLLFAFAAGTLGSFVAAAIARHRLWLHMGIFLAMMAVVDTIAVFGFLAPQPVWLKAVVLLSLPLQAWLGGMLARIACRTADAHVQ